MSKYSGHIQFFSSCHVTPYNADCMYSKPSQQSPTADEGHDEAESSGKKQVLELKSTD